MGWHHTGEMNTNIRKCLQEHFLLLSVGDLPAEGPIGFKDGPSQPHRAALPLVGSVDGRDDVPGNNRATGSEAGWSTFHSNEALLPNLRAQRHTEVLFTLYSRFLSVQFGSVQSGCVAIDGFCVCKADHTSVIFTIIIEIYRVVVFLLWSPPGLSPACPHGNMTLLWSHVHCKNIHLSPTGFKPLHESKIKTSLKTKWTKIES